MYRLDRFSRDYDHQIILREQLRYYGVTIVTLDPDEHASGDSIADRIVQLVFGMMAELELKKITERTHDGLIERYQAGFLPVSRRPLYGYSWEDRTVNVRGEERTVPKAVYVLKEVVIHTDPTGKEWTEYHVVQYIFELADKGIAIRVIAKNLTNLGIPSPDGKPFWSHQTVLDRLKHRGYTGKHAANKLKWTYEENVGWRKEVRAETEWIPMSDGVIPQLVNVERFERVQKRLATNKQNATRNNPNAEDTLLRAGFARCGYCGMKLTVVRSLVQNTISYACPLARRGHGECQGCSVISHTADDFAWNKCVEVIRNPALVEIELAKRQSTDRIADEVDNLTRLIEALVPRMQNIMETIAESPKGDGRALLVVHLGELQAQKTRFEEDRDILVRRQRNWQEEQKKIEAFKLWCTDFRRKVDTQTITLTYREKRDAVEYLGACLMLYRMDRRPRMTVGFNPPDIVTACGRVSWCQVAERYALPN